VTPDDREMVDFLRAKLEQDKARQQDIWEQWHHKDCEAVPQVLYPDRETGTCDCGVPARVIADIDAKLALVDDYVQTQESLDRWSCPDMVDVGRGDGLESAVERVAALYDQDPAYPKHLKA
jgi:hypothetical protein